MSLEEQLSLLEGFLKEQIDSDYVYLDIPCYFNVGDHLIYNGAICILKRITSYKCRYQTVIENFDPRFISNDVIIILQGGGNWGSGYYTPFRTRIVESFPNNKIIFMPQTIRYDSQEELEKDAAVYSKHTKLHLCVRDRASFEILQKHFSANHLYLLPDSAIGLYGTLPKYMGDKTTSNLYIKRADNEASLTERTIEDCFVKDWDSILKDLHFSRLKLPYKIIRKLKKITGNRWLKRVANSYFIHIFEPWLIKNVPSYFLNYNKLYTTRLHGLILARLLDMPVEWIDTRFGKISNYCDTWLND